MPKTRTKRLATPLSTPPLAQNLRFAEAKRKNSATPEIVDIFGFNNINYPLAPLFVHAFFFLRFASTKRKFFTKKSVDSVFLRAR